MKQTALSLFLGLFLSSAFAAPIDVTIVQPDGRGHVFTSVHHAHSKKPAGNGPATTVEGTLEVLHADDFAKGKSEYHYRVRAANGELTALNVDSLPAEIHRAKVRVAGKRGKPGTSLEPAIAALDPSEVTVFSAPAALTGQGWTGDVKVLFAFLQYNGAPSSNPGFAGSPQAQAVVDQYVQFVAKASYGLVNIQPTISSLISVNWSSPSGSACDTGVIYGGNFPMGGANGALRDANPAWDLTTMLTGVPGAPAFRDVVYIMPQASCGWKGLANVGWYNAWIAGPENFYLMTVAHETGHNFGNWHAGSGGGVPGSMWSVQEYGDPYGCMGSNANCGAYNAQEKFNIGWLNGLQRATYVIGSGTKSYTLTANEDAGGALYQVLVPTDNALVTYSVEASQGAVQIRAVRPFTTDMVAGSDDTVLLAEHTLALGQSATLPGGYTVTFTSPTTTTTTVPPSLVANGGFETPTTPGFAYGPTGGSWIFTGASGIQKNGSAWSAPTATDGAQTAFVQMTGSISQAVTLNAGSYTLKLMAAQRQCCVAPYGNPVNVTLDGAVVGTLNPGAAFQAYSFPLTVGATGPHTLAFIGTVTSHDVATFIDSVTLQ